MNRRTRYSTTVQCLTFLIVGCILSLAVAWSLSLFVQMSTLAWTNTQTGIVSSNVVHWAIIVEDRRGATMLRMKACDNPDTASSITAAMHRLLASQGPVAAPMDKHFPHWLPSGVIDSRAMLEGSSWVTVRTVGWPARCMFEIEFPFSSQGGPNRTYRSFPVGQAQLPIGVFWAGLATNTVFFAALSWAAWRSGRSLVQAQIRRRRSKQGRCTNCGYPRTDGVTICSECGLPTC